MPLIVQSPYHTLITFLLTRPKLASSKRHDISIEEDGFGEKPNCHGTTLFILGKYCDRSPYFVSPRRMEDALGIADTIPKNRHSVISFWVHTTLEHTAIYLGSDRKGRDVLFHQEDTGRPFGVVPFSNCYYFSSSTHFTFYNPGDIDFST